MNERKTRTKNITEDSFNAIKYALTNCETSTAAVCQMFDISESLCSKIRHADSYADYCMKKDAARDAQRIRKASKIYHVTDATPDDEMPILSWLEENLDTDEDPKTEPASDTLKNAAILAQILVWFRVNKDFLMGVYDFLDEVADHD